MSYIFSKLTLKYYSLDNGIYTIIHIDDSKEEYNTMMSSGNITEVDSLPFEIEELNKPKVPEEISRMKFKIQIRRSTIYSYDIILTYMQNLAVTEIFTQDDKDELIDRLEDAVSFNRYHKDFINIANMLGVSDEIKDEIFIEGNKIV